MKRINFVIFALLSILFLFAWSCSDSAATFDSLLDSHAEQTEKAYITFAPLQSRTILPAYSVDDMTNFVLSGTHAGNTETLGTFATKTALLSARIAIEEGSWTFTLTAKKGGSTFTGSVSYEVKMGDNPLSFSLSLDEENISAQDGKGTVSVKITFPADSGVQLVKAGLFNEETDTEISGFELEVLAITGNAITYEKEEVPADTYRLKAFFYGDENAQVYMNTFKEIVVVAADCTSSAERNIEKLNELYTVHYERNGGNFASGSVIQETFSRHSEIALPMSDSISRTGYEFKGWYTDSTFTQAVTEIASGTTESVTVWAKWVVTAETLDEFDGSSVFENETVLYEGNLLQTNLSSLCEKLANSEYDFTLDLAVAVILNRISDISTYGDSDYRYYLPMRDKDSSESYFEKCTKLKSIILPNMMQVMRDATFRNCINLESVKLPDGLIGALGGFSGCVSLKNINIPENVTSISGFSGCSSLEVIEIPESVVSIGMEAFKDCVELKSIILPKNLKTIGSRAFEGCTKIQTVQIPEGVTSIGNQQTFKNCTSLMTVVIPSTITSITSEAFYGCKNLKYVTLPDELTTIYEYAFYGCTNLETIIIPRGVTSIGKYAYNQSGGVGGSTYGGYTFYGCTNLKSVTIFDSVESIEVGVFQSCSTLDTITFAGTKSQWNAITKGASWNYNIPATKVICSDGEVELCASL